MHTVDLLEECVTVATQLGYRVRQEWLGGVGGGSCAFGGRQWIFLDLGLNAAEQLEQAAAALRTDTRARQLPLSPQLRRVLHHSADPAAADGASAAPLPASDPTSSSTGSGSQPSSSKAA